MRYIIVLLFINCLLFSCTKKTTTSTDIDSIKELSVWGEAPFSAFTDLFYYNSEYYCAFREGKSHTSYDGKIRIVKSGDGNAWYKFDLITEEKKDLRDPHFYVDNNGMLCIGMNGRSKDGTREGVIFKLKNGHFSEINKMDADNDYYLWSFSKFKDSVYSIGYNVNQPCYNANFNTKIKLSLFNNTDPQCIKFKNISTGNWITDSFICPSEASTVFTNDSTLITIVRDQDILGYSHIGVSKYPFKEFTWKKFPYYIRGPKLALLPDGRLFLAGASLIDLYKTYYVILDPKHDFAVQTIKVFPSYGDSGYPGVIVEDNSVLVSYYSSHEGRTKVYIVRLNY